MRPSYEALPEWLSRLPKMAPTPLRPHAPPEEGLLRRTVASSRLPLHVAILAIALGIAAAVAAGSARARHVAESRTEMSAFAESKVAELRAFGALRSSPARQVRAALPVGGSLDADVAGYHDVVDGTDGRRFQRRWLVDSTPARGRRVVVRITPVSREAAGTSLEVTSIIPPP